MNEALAAKRQAKYPWIAGAEVLEDGTGTVIAYLFGRNDRPIAYGFTGRRTKADFRYSFRSLDEARRYAKNWLKTAGEEAKADQIQRAFEHTLKVGDILVSSWGYEQTNVEFFEVVKTKGKKTVVLRQRNVVRGPEKGFMTADAVPGNGFSSNKLRTFRVRSGNWVRLNSYSSANPWDGKPQRISWYA